MAQAKLAVRKKSVKEQHEEAGQVEILKTSRKRKLQNKLKRYYRLVEKFNVPVKPETQEFIATLDDLKEAFLATIEASDALPDTFRATRTTHPLAIGELVSIRPGNPDLDFGVASWAVDKVGEKFITIKSKAGTLVVPRKVVARLS